MLLYFWCIIVIFVLYIYMMMIKSHDNSIWDKYMSLLWRRVWLKFYWEIIETKKSHQGVIINLWDSGTQIADTANMTVLIYWICFYLSTQIYLVISFLCLVNWNFKCCGESGFQLLSFNLFLLLWWFKYTAITVIIFSFISF